MPQSPQDERGGLPPLAVPSRPFSPPGDAGRPAGDGGEAFPTLPPARPKRKPPRVCEACGCPGGRSYTTDGLCGPCRAEAARARLERMNGG